MKTYQMYNGFSSKLLEEYPVIEAKSGAEACKKLLASLKIKYTKIIRSGSGDVIIKAEPFYEEDGRKYRDGAISWFEVWNGKTIYR